MPSLRLALLRLDDPHRIYLVRALPIVRQHGCAAHFERTWDGHAGLGVSPVSRSRISLCPLPESLFLISDLPPHYTHAATRGTKGGVSIRPALALFFTLEHAGCRGLASIETRETLPTSIRNWCKEPVNPGLSASGAVSRRLILSFLHIRIEFDLFDPFEYLFKQELRASGIEARFRALGENRRRT